MSDKPALQVMHEAIESFAQLPDAAFIAAVRKAEDDCSGIKDIKAWRDAVRRELDFRLLLKR
jgi:hypothetical protein